MRTFIILGIFMVNIHSLPAQKLVPADFSFRTLIADSTDSLTSSNNMRSNVVTEIILQTDSTIWLGTGLGVSIISVIGDSFNIETIPDTIDLVEDTNPTILTNRLPKGGISAMDVSGQGNVVFVAVAGSENDIPVGKGLVITTNATDSDISWDYYDQPIDAAGKDTITWGGLRFKYGALPITVTQANVTYDVAIGERFVWIASWAGGLRRLGYNSEIPIWERVPLPLDNQFELTTCEDSSYVRVRYDDGSFIDVLKDYVLNPRDPIDGGNHNHKTFSVMVYGDTIWVGTANGINRGIINPDETTGFCIDWKHYSYPTDGLSGNFVVGLALQMYKGKRIIWAATVNADDPTEQRGVSYSANDGLSWNSTLLGERVYNITAHDSLVFAATASGLWKTEDGINWARYSRVKQDIHVQNTTIHNTDEVLANEVYSVAFDTSSFWIEVDGSQQDRNSIWIGTGDGVAHSYDLDGRNWKIFRAEYDKDEDYAYPNPFSPYTHNVIGGDGYVRFHTNEWSGTFVIDFDIYNFALEKVFAGSFDRRVASSGALKWNGRDTQGRLVNNGVYFVKLTYPENQTSKPSPHWVKLIVVK